MTQEKIIQQGAEAILIKKENLVLKRRVAKGYRLKELDEKIRKLRTRGEARLLEKAGKIIPVPRVLKVDEKTKEIDMEFIDGWKLSEKLDEMKNWEEGCVAIGKNIALLHDAGIIHGDLTTSNMIWRELNAQTEKRASSSYQLAPLAVTARSARISKEKDGKKSRLYFIDFGLGFANGHVEDKAVDLYLIKGALEAKHFKRFEEYFKAVLEGYKISKNFKEVLKRLEKVEKRGRYKEQY